VRIRESTVSLFERVRLKGWLTPLDVAVAIRSRGKLRLLCDRDILSCSSFRVGRCPSWSFSSSSQSLDDESEGDVSLRLDLGCLPLSKSRFADEDDEDVASPERSCFEFMISTKFQLRNVTDDIDGDPIFDPDLRYR
jgi:hypothetical protein